LLLGTMLPIPGNIEIKIVKSGSMEPAISTGSLVVVKPATTYRAGDIITFGKDTKNDIPTTHRIIEITSAGSFLTKGDANEEADPNPVARQDVIGAVLLSVPGAGYVLDFARQPLGFLLLVAIPAGLVIIEEIFTIVREARRWMRRRRDDDRGGGGTVFDDVSAHLKRVYAKRRAMDEIKVMVYARPRFGEMAWWKWKIGFGRDSYTTSTGLTVGLLFVAMLFAGESGGTMAYFSDIERSVGNLFQAGVWADEVPPPNPQSVVLNEFLPRPSGVAYGFDFGNSNSNMPQGEWIELYNNGDVPISVLNWYMTDASGGGGNTHAVISASNTQPATTTIPAHGWLVVYMNKPTLNHTGDEIYLYTDGDVLVDSVTYAPPADGCFYEPSPTEENATTTPTGTPGNGQNGDCNANLVPPNKSYARIPDGTGDWVDPIPTPGEPNIPDPEPLPESVATEDVIEDTNDAQGEILGKSDEKNSLGGGGGGGGNGTPPAHAVSEETDGEEVEDTQAENTDSVEIIVPPAEEAKDSAAHEPPIDAALQENAEPSPPAENESDLGEEPMPEPDQATAETAIVAESELTPEPTPDPPADVATSE
jgi:signal peptidase